jgi:DNA replication protein DnaC
VRGRRVTLQYIDKWCYHFLKGVNSDEKQPVDAEAIDTLLVELREYDLRRDADVKQEFWNSLINSCGSRYVKCRFDSFEFLHPGQQNTVSALRQYADGFTAKSGGLFLYGPPGTGKDHLLMAVAHDIIQKHSKVCHESSDGQGEFEYQLNLSFRWIDGMNFFSGLRSGMGDKEFNESSYLDNLIYKDVLILSDPLPPHGVLTDYQSAMLFAVIDGRYRHCRPTWISANIATAAEFAERAGAQIIDRAKDGALCVHCNWPSYRKAGQNVVVKQA